MRTIRVHGRDKGNYKGYKDFYCYGNKNINEVCEECRLKFECFTVRGILKVNTPDLPIKYLENIDAIVIADYITPLIKVSIRESKDGKKKAQIDFRKVRKF